MKFKLVMVNLYALEKKYHLEFKKLLSRDIQMS